MSTIGYVRVSSTDQNPDRQTDALEAKDVERVFVDRMSGANTNRPELQAMLAYVRKGDTVIVESISRLARSTRDLLTIVETLREKSVELVSLKESIDTTTPAGRFMLSVFAALSALERDNIRVRQAEGIAAARARGKHLGRPRREYPAEWEVTYKAWKSGGIKAVEAMRLLGLPKSVFYKLVKRWEAEAKGKAS